MKIIIQCDKYLETKFFFNIQINFSRTLFLPILKLSSDFIFEKRPFIFVSLPLIDGLIRCFDMISLSLVRILEIGRELILSL